MATMPENFARGSEVKSLTFGSPTESTTRLAGQLQKDRTAELLTLSGALKVSQEENAVLREKCDRRSATFNTLRVRYERLRFFTVVTLIAVAVLVGLKFLCVPGQCRSTPAIPGLESSLWHQALYGIAGFEVQRPWQLALPTVRCHLFEASVILEDSHALAVQSCFQSIKAFEECDLDVRPYLAHMSIATEQPYAASSRNDLAANFIFDGRI